MFEDITSFIRDLYKEPVADIPLHAPLFGGNEEKYVLDTIRSTYVSSVGAYVNRFEDEIRAYTGSAYAIATVNGTTALHLALVVAGVQSGDEVITQPLTFVATANAIVHAAATPVFVDVDRDTLGLSAQALKDFLTNFGEVRNGICYNRRSGKRIAACVPMHTFGFPVKINAIVDICNQYGIPVIEDAAESLGSSVNGKHTGTFGLAGIFSFNGNKTITCGGGGVIITNDKKYGELAKHLSTTARIPQSWEFVHDKVGYNYRMPNLNAALACAQMEHLDAILESKRTIAEAYKAFFHHRTGIEFLEEQPGTRSNYWLNTILMEDRTSRDRFLAFTNENKVMTRPIWKLMQELPMYRDCQAGPLENAKWLGDRIINLPSSPRSL